MNQWLAIKTEEQGEFNKKTLVCTGGWATQKHNASGPIYWMGKGMKNRLCSST